mmetsp:Transcript_17397/g.28072  ORF Transcript_17397/g.28072 Transcript_17397/m.28072 type:complete len:206 (-) Transcript_17397:1036-1653(-)
MSLSLSTMKTKPSSSMYPTSSVCSQPPRKVSRVLDSISQYPFITCGPRVTISPTDPRGTSFPSVSQIITSTQGTGRPTEVSLGWFLTWNSSPSMHTAGDVSVKPNPPVNFAFGKLAMAGPRSALGIGDAPYMIFSKDEQSYLLLLGTCIIIPSIAGTIIAFVTRKSWIAASMSSGTNFEMNTWEPPTTVIPKVDAPSARWNIGAE